MFSTKAEMIPKSDLRSFFPVTEYLFFAEHKGADGYALQCDDLRGFVFEPLRAYLAGEWQRAGLKFEQANEACGTANMAGRHFFSRSQWCLPTQEHYASLQVYANVRGRRPAPSYEEYHEAPRSRFEPGMNGHGPEYLRAEYEDLRAEYEDLWRPFSVSKDVHYTDVWPFPTVQAYPGKHPCEKPLAMLEHIVKTSSREGDLVLDPFMGSGASAIAALKNGRRYAGIEIERRWCDVARKHVRMWQDKGIVSFPSGRWAEDREEDVPEGQLRMI